MNTVCPSFQCPPTMPSAPPRSLSSLAASVHLPQFRQSLFPYVSDRLGSSGIVPDRTTAPPPAARHSRRIAEIFARFRPPNRQKSASIRVKIRLQRPVRKKPLRGIWELLSFPTTGQQKSASTACLRSTLTLVRMNLGAQTAARAAAVNRVLHQNQMNWTSDKCQPALNTIHHPPSTIHHPLSAIHCSYTADSLPKSGLPPYRPSVDPHLMQPVCSKVLQDIQISATLDPTNRKIQWQPLRNAAESTFTPVSPARQTHTTLTPPNRRLPPPPAISTDDAKLPPGPRKDRLGTRSAPSSDPETLLQSPQWYPQSKQCHQ